MKIFLYIFTFCSISICVGVPPIINYAGQIAVDGEGFNGGGLFKFKLVETDKNTTLWSNDGNNSNEGEPNSAIAIQVSGGLYSILLGNTAIPGMEAIDPNIFKNNLNVKLQVWFSDGVNGFQKLNPDRPFASVPYAFSAGAAPLKEGSVTLSHLSQEVINELNSTITKSRLSSEILDELNATIRRERLSQDLRNELNATIPKSRLSLSLQNELYSTIGKDRLSTEIQSELNSTQTLASIVSMNTGIFDSGLRAYLRPILRGGINVTSAIEGQVAELRAPTVEGRFLLYQWYKDGEEIPDANSTSYTISEFNSSRDAGEYEIHVSNDFATLKTKAILEEANNLTVTQVASGHENSYFLKSDGSLWGAGLNAHGQLGDGTNSRRYNPIKIIDANVTKIKSYLHNSLFLKSDGSLWGMGMNHYGEISGDDLNSTYVHQPVRIIESSVIDMAIGRNHSLFIKSDNTLWGMGLNAHGQLGEGNVTSRSSPIQIDSNVAKVTCGVYRSLFIKTDGSLWGMGRNHHGGLGDGSTTDRNVPIEILSSGVTEIAAGEHHSLFVKTDGSLWAMGLNSHGQLGDGSTTTRLSPVEIVTSGVSKIAAGYRFSSFLKTDGSLWSMGGNWTGQLGDGTAINRLTPVQVEASGVNFLECGWHNLLYLKSNGTYWASGRNAYAALGDGNGIPRYSPIQPRLLSISVRSFVHTSPNDVVENP